MDAILRARRAPGHSVATALVMLSLSTVAVEIAALVTTDTVEDVLETSVECEELGPPLSPELGWLALQPIKAAQPAIALLLSNLIRIIEPSLALWWCSPSSKQCPNTARLASH